MKILILAPQPFFQLRGTPIAVRLLAGDLAKIGHCVDLLVYHEGEDADLEGVQVLRIPHIPFIHNIGPGFSVKKLFCDAMMLIACWKLARRHRYDLIHAVEESVFVAMAVKSFFAIPYIYDMDSSLPEQLVERFPLLRGVLPILTFTETLAIRKSAGVLAVCKSLSDKAQRLAPSALVQTLEDISLLPPVTDGRIEPGNRLFARGPVVMYVGNLEPYQGVDLLLQSFQILHQSLPEATLVIIGGRSGAIADYRRMAASMNIGQKTLFLGPKPLKDLHQYLAQAHVLVSPRVHGRNTPMKIYSYLDSGKPLVATRLETHTQALDDEISLLVDPAPEPLADGIAALLRNPELARRLGENGRTRAQYEYSQEGFTRKLAGFYHCIATKSD